MGKINLTPLSMRGQDLDDSQAIRRIESYLYQLSEQLRYELTHIDEDNMAANNTTVYTAPSSSGESAAAQTVNGQTIDLNDNTVIVQLKARIAELQKGQQTALNGVNNNTQAITDANREISSIKNKLDNLGWSYNRHKHSIEIDASGNLSMGGPTANPTYPNIADTQFYIDGVAAAAAAVDFSRESLWSSGSKTLTLSNGKTHTVNIPDPTNYSSAKIGDKLYSVSYTVGGKSFTYSQIDTSGSYDAGANSVGVSSWGTPSWNASGVTITITLTNGVTRSHFYAE